MKCLRIISYVALAGKLASGSDGGAERVSPLVLRANEAAAKPTAMVNLPVVMKKLEPADSQVLRLPGPAVSRRVSAAPPAATPVAKEASVGLPALPVTSVAPITPSSVLTPHIDTTRLAAKPEGLLSVSVPPVPRPSASKWDSLPVWRPRSVPSLPYAPAVAERRSIDPAVIQTLAVVGTIPAPLRPDVEGMTSLPPDLIRESAIFCQKEIGQISLSEARAIFGEPRRQRPASDEEEAENGHIYAFRDPTGRYKELELDFGSEKGLLRAVFVYPWNLTWLECRRLWGSRVSATEGNQGRVFYSYVNRHLDVLVDHQGKVISLGLY